MTQVKHKKKNKRKHYSYSKEVKKPFEYFRVFQAMLLVVAFGCEAYISVINDLPWNYTNMIALLLMFLAMTTRQLTFAVVGFSFGLIGSVGTLISSIRSIWILWEYMVDQMFASTILLICGSVLAIVGYVLYIVMCVKKQRILVKGMFATLFCLVNVSIYGFAWGSYSLTLWHLPMIVSLLYMTININRIAKTE